MRQAWTLAAAIAALLTIGGCTEDGPANITEAEPETPEAFDPEHSPETFYKPVMALPGPMHGVGTPTYRLPRYYRFESESAKRRFMAEVIGPPSPGWIIGFKAVDHKHPGVAFLDVRLDGGEVQTELVNSTNNSRIDWRPRNAWREPGGTIRTH